MYRYSRLVIFFVLMVSGGLSQAQDAQFSQFYANPLYLNPALAGATECGRAILNYRNQWRNFSNAYVTYNLSYDQNLPGINSGFGVLVMNDRQGDGALSRTSASLYYAYKLKVSDPIVISFGVKGGYYQERLEWDKLIFADQINPTTGEIDNPTAENRPPKDNVSVVDFSAGAVLGYYDEWFVGVAVDHLTQPNLSFYDDPNSKLPMKITAHGGVTVNITQGMLGNDDPDDFILQPNILYMQQDKFHQLNLGLYLKKSPLVVGAWFRHNFQNPDAFIALVGITFNHIRFGYSYDVTVSKLSGSGGSHELSLAWDFCIFSEAKRRHIRAINSPSF
ncbi:MAG: type IX secretion system membrane protein PorP/SprF [Bacteroidales bacterium]|nr:type IX secretion system membrane protein PorP/SprF [Bacteroidales bacterium]